MASSPGRDTYFDAVRGVAILAVVWIHASNMAKDFYSAPPPWSGNFLASLLFRQILLAAVPVFMFLSGYFLTYRLQPGDRITSADVRRRLMRVLIPYLFWSILLSVKANGLRHPGEILEDILCGSAVSPYYFMASLMMLTVLSPLLVRLSTAGWFVPAILAITAAHIGLAYVLRAASPGVNWWYFMYPFTAWLAYYGLGVAKGYDRGAAASRGLPSAPVLLVIALIALAASMGEAVALTRALGLDGGGLEPVKLSSFVYALAIIGLIVAGRERAVLPGWAALLGGCSFGVFLVHEPVVGRLQKMLPKLHRLYEMQLAAQFVVVVVATLVCVGVVFAARWALGMKRSERLFGL